MVLLQTQPGSLETMVQEGLARSADDADLANIALESLPLVVIAADASLSTIPVWTEAQTQLATLSKDGEMIVAERSGHYIQLDEPDIVIRSVRKVLSSMNVQR
jgi:pimeloyl-ACP methyl ester carboxylesterase